MSARKMVADSTQDDSRVKKRKKLATKALKKKKNVKKRKSEESYAPELMDLELKLLPISGYIRNPDLMIDHMLMSVKGPTLAGMLPDILKKMPLDELKNLCQGELEVMSKKRVRRIIEGAEPEDISSSDSNDELESSGDEEENEQEANEQKETAREDREETVEEDAESLIDISDEEDFSNDSSSNREDDEEDEETEVKMEDCESVASPAEVQGTSERATDEEEEESDVEEMSACNPNLEEGEVLSSGEEDFDPMWRSRGEEEMQREEEERAHSTDIPMDQASIPATADDSNTNDDPLSMADQVELDELVDSEPIELDPGEPASEQVTSEPAKVAETAESDDKLESAQSCSTVEVSKDIDDNDETCAVPKPESVAAERTESVTACLDPNENENENRAPVLSADNIKQEPVEDTVDSEALKSEPRTPTPEPLADSPAPEPTMEITSQSSSNPGSPADIFADLNTISSTIMVDETSAKPVINDDQKPTDNSEKQASSSTIEPTIFKTNRKIKVSRPHLRGHQSQSCQSDDSETMEVTKTEKSKVERKAKERPKRVKFDDSCNSVRVLSSEKKSSSNKDGSTGKLARNKSLKSAPTSEPSCSDVLVVSEDISDFEDSNKQEDAKDENETSEEPSQGSLELLELEMRARAIKAMLKVQNP